MSRRTRLMAALALIALLGAGCSNASTDTGTGDSGGDSATRAKAVKFAGCMRDHGVKNFPDPDASGELTIDEIANGSAVDTSSPAFEQALRACKDLQPPGFTGRKRSASQQETALKFAQCMRENGVKDFPDPDPNGPLIDTNQIPSAQGRGARDIPGFDAAAHKCGAIYAGELGLTDQ